MLSSIDPALAQLINQRFPAASAAGSVLALDGLSGQSLKVMLPDRTLLARRACPQAMPGVSRQREYRILRKLAVSGLAPPVLGCNAEWLLLGWQPGEALDNASADAWLPPLIDLLATLHARPPVGYRLALLPLLQSYWQRSCPTRRHASWLRQLQQLGRRGEPAPLRLAPLHMDIHGGNLVSQYGRLSLIDWEYAGDGDVALELAAIISANHLDDAQQRRLVTGYARRQRLETDRLQRQITRWQPWLALLGACWYELRWQQSGEAHFRQRADDGWQRLRR